MLSKAKRFFRHWFLIAPRDAISHVFGWPTLCAALALTYVSSRLGLRPIQSGILNNLAIAGMSLSLALAVSAFVALFKAYRMVTALTLTVTDKIRSPDFTCNEKVCGYSVAVVVHNRSTALLRDCVAHVLDMPSVGGSLAPHFVEKFDMPPRSTKNIYVAYWFSRDAPSSDDKKISLSGPRSAGFDTTCRVPDRTVLRIRVQAEDQDSQEVRCRVWIDAPARSLKACHLPEHEA